MQNRRLANRLLAALALPCLPLSAATWTGAGDGWSWANPDNWEGGALPMGGETVTMRPPDGSSFLEIGGATGGGAISLVVESQDNLRLYLNPEARLSGLRTVGPGWHQIEGTPEASSAWEIDHGGSATLRGLSPDAVLEKRGGGLLVIGAGATAAGGLRLRGLGGSVVIEVDQPDALERATLEATGASISFTGEVTRAGKLVIGEGNFGSMTGGRLAAGEVVVARSGYLDLGNLQRIEAGVLRMEGGTVRMGDSVEAGRLALTNGTLELGDARVGNVLEVRGGWIDGGVIAGEVAVDSGGGISGWMGSASIAAGGRLTWKPAEAAATIWVMGELAFEEGSSVAIAEADWSSPFWDTARTFAFIDPWGQGIVRGVPELEGARVAGEGSWGLRTDAQGGLELTWTAEAAPVPEGSTLGWAVGLGILAGLARPRRGLIARWIAGSVTG